MHAPHYLRFARAIALVTATTAAGCCPMVPRDMVCAHCACPGATRSVTRPMTCEAIERRDECCPLPVPGPLAPPCLAV